MRIGSLFSGIGGLELGLEWAGVGHTVWQVEWDEWRRSKLHEHWPLAVQHDDVRTFDRSKAPWVHVICGGFPCQGISNAGNRMGLDDPRSGLWHEYIRIVRLFRPWYVVVENSAALIGRGIDTVLRDLATSGYDAEWSVLRCCDVGGTHERERLFLVAHAHEKHGEEGLGLRALDDRHGPLRRISHPSRLATLAELEDAASALRADDGLPVGLDRRRAAEALGDAVVPQVAEIVGRRLLDIHERTMRRAA